MGKTRKTIEGLIMNPECVELIDGCFSKGDAARLLQQLEQDGIVTEFDVGSLTARRLSHKYGVDELKAEKLVERLGERVVRREEKKKKGEKRLPHVTFLKETKTAKKKKVEVVVKRVPGAMDVF